MPLSNKRELFLDNCWTAEAGEEARLKGVEDPAFNCRASFKAAGVKLLTSLSLPEERNDFLCFRFCFAVLGWCGRLVGQMLSNFKRSSKTVATWSQRDFR